ncbi:hypothetical protein [Empedobacter falsenii]|uniref:Uncharacterized protein n=1 Tax=Empedobacter falsenii TaxID=343874 RepID=A0AAW7DNU2_9FLAO|nr:hypothetical protein [Empedobacter falsenii]MDM1552839.1 hypothetical protein [Empedobacter falsenii]
MKVELKYPVFTFQKNNNMIYVFFKERNLKSTSENLLNEHGFIGNIIIDSLGNKFRIKNVSKVKYLGLWGFNPLLKGRQILIDFEYESKLDQISLEDFKKEILLRINKTKKIWISSWDINELRDAILNSSSFDEIAHLLK